ncbi:hypothetical protein ABI59_22330 [Acidobacteria bacterium Mor1]|nr:hypothetical protein ABI59_22330 [Acidobacteria bacterium Mor1]
MIKERRTIAVALVGIIALGAAGAVIAGGGKGEWTQWGGSQQNFHTEAKLATTWSDEGPKEVWSRELGEGYSAVLHEGGKLYTMYRGEDQEVVAALDAKSGETLWEHRYDSGPRDGHVEQFGNGPRATPLIQDNRIYTIGISGMMHCLNKKDGSVMWSQDLWGDGFDGNFLNHGYSSSPVAYGNTIVVLVGGKDKSVVALDAKTGETKWARHSFENSYSTPRVMNIAGVEQMVIFMAEELIAVDPANGDLLWTVPHKNQWKQNVNQPVMAGDVLFMSSPQAGAKGLRISKGADGYDVEEVWSTRKIQFYHVTSVKDGDYVYGSTGTMGPAFMAAVNIKTGEIAWRKRGFAKANVLMAGDKLVLLDEDGKLAVTSASPEDLEIHAQAQLLDKVAWTVPTVVGKVIFLRDQKHLKAYRIG